MQFSGHYCYFSFAAMLYSQIHNGEEEEEGEREREEESKLQLAEVFGLNSENDPFNSDGL